MSRDPRIDAVLGFWFGEPAERALGRARAAWFRKDPAFDDAIRERFGPLVEAALAGGLADWGAGGEGGDAGAAGLAGGDAEARGPDAADAADAADGALALLVVCDQFPRNLYRDDARAFALDPRARATARRMVANGLDRSLRPVERAFVYLPFEHSESLADQHEAVRLFGALRDDPDAGGYLDWAVRHLEVIERFGRFPHRNDALGRVSTDEERAFLARPGSRF